MQAIFEVIECIAGFIREDCTCRVTKLGYCLSFLRYKCATKNQIHLKTKIGNALKPDTSEIPYEVRSRVELLYMVLQTTT